MGTSGMRLDSTHFTQLNSFNSSHTTELTQLISLSVPPSTSLNSSFVRRGTWTLLSPPRPCPRLCSSMFRVQCFRWQAIKVQCFCVQRNMNAFVPPRPCPRLCSRCSASDDRRSRCSAFVCRGTWTLLSPPRPCQDYVQGAVLLMTGDQGAVLLCAGEHERFCPPRPCQDYVQGAVLLMTGDQGAVLLCAEEHERFCLPPRPCQDYVQGAVLLMTGDQGAVLLCAEEHERFCPPPAPAKTMFKVQCFWWQAIKVQCFCVQRNMNAFVSPPTPQPNPKWLSQVMF